jgi:hypothetical protein
MAEILIKFFSTQLSTIFLLEFSGLVVVLCEHLVLGSTDKRICVIFYRWTSYSSHSPLKQTRQTLIKQQSQVLSQSVLSEVFGQVKLI